MARDLAPKYKRSRREGIELHPDLDKAGTAKSPFTRRGYAPGAHGPKKSWSKQSNYAVQLREKQKTKRIYGILERQFRGYYDKALRKTGDTGEVMLAMLESRLDNVVYRLGFAKTRPAARQMVNHGHVLLNGKRCDIPSCQTKIGDLIEIKEKSGLKETAKLIDRNAPSWIALEAGKGKIVAAPDLEEPKNFSKMRAIVEFYSK